MTFLEIEAFLKIAQCGSFSAAAEKLYITQPALGRRIRALEEELGYSLFIRNKGVRHVELTRQGRAFVGIAHRWQALWNETQEELNYKRQLSEETQKAEELLDEIMLLVCVNRAVYK